MKILLAFPMNDNQTGLFIKKAFEQLKQDVSVVNLDKTNALVSEVVKIKPDAIFCSRTATILPDMMIVKRDFPQVKTVCWNVDKRDHVMEFGPHLIQLFDTVDLFYTIASGNIREYSKICPNTSVRHLQQGCDPEVHHTEILTNVDHEKYDCDLMFAGGRTNVHGQRDQLIKMILNSKQLSFKQYGRQFNNFITDSEHNKACQCSKIVLGHNGWPSVAISMSVRDYKVMAAGGFLLTEYCPGMEDWYDLGKMCESYRTKEECLEKINYYLDHEEERNKIAAAGQKCVHAKHKYVDRMKIVVKDLETFVKKDLPVEISWITGKKILLGISEGIGNQVQALPFVNYAKMQYPEYKFDVLYMEGTQFKFTKYLFDKDPRISRTLNWTEELPQNYEGVIIAASTLKDKPRNLKCPNLTKFKLNGHAQRMKTSEVVANLLSVILPKTQVGFGFSEEEVSSIFDLRPYLVKKESSPIAKLDVLIHNGYNRNNSSPGLWSIKEYPYFEEVAKKLIESGLTVGCIGSNEEKIKGCQDYTELEFSDTINMIDNCRCFLSNDTGTYHIRAALNKPGIVIFTAMSYLKNYDKNFHKSIELIYNDPKCGYHPCQVQPGTFWTNCKVKHKCKEIGPDIIVERVLNKLKTEN